MEETALLTDDEIVALCVADGRPWPLGLPTVTATSDELTRAGVRGMRSLMVRRLAGGDAAQPGVRPHELIAQDVAAFLDATVRIGAYLAPAANHTALGGASVTAARTQDGWVVDSTTAAGVHALRAATGDEAAEAVIELAEKTYRGDFFADTAAGAKWACVVRLGTHADDRLVLGRERISGTVCGAAVIEWDAQLIRTAFELSTA
ncbi:hypothetical protein [Mycobacterium sp. ACS4331]|uniref:hypothetical protein n=1 Tax=Mycobacterium sp. ACS4331 TaxID=1834121 RepID=UPI0007FFC477|nr:hypothetical protein [Mycobacterium sp. ACS4331]OBF29137.1 hypothetical protein A5727_24135 [Mycobacterium sp. ACS4331]